MTSTPEWPTFSEQYENAIDKDVRFHEFIGELFGPRYRNRPGFATFLSAGNDGAIDCFHPDGEVWECKFVGAAGYAAATARWKEVKKHLFDNLLANAPKSSQYQPWYNATTPIRHYYFCTSNTLENDARLQELEALIKADFLTLSKRADLEHLEQIKVEVWSWERLGPELQHYPHLRLKWFPNPVPPVFKTLAMWMRNYSQGFRTYLTEAVLPYVALPDANLAPAQILATFLASGQPCSVLTGIGGAGKSRLLAETAALAQSEGWLVYMPGNNLTAEDISKLARLLGDGPVFIGLDYLEKCAQFEQVLDAVVEANESGKQMVLLATCRQSYWQQIDNFSVRQYSLAQLDLQQVVQRILGPDLQDFAKECRDVPVFAAFVRFLAATKQIAALAELRAAPDFTTWLIDHILKSGNAANALRQFDQARLMVMLPASEAALKELEREVPALVAWRSVLEEDGWLLGVTDVEAEGGLLWQTAHDVIADGTVLRALEIVGTRHANAVRLLASARMCGAVPAALQALQRIAREAHTQGIDWLQVFAAEKQTWGSHVEAILSSRLLVLESCFPFLQWYQADAAQLVVSDEVQGTLGFVTRALGKGLLTLPQEQEAALLPWLAAAVQAGGKFNFVLTQALRWRPAQFKTAALQWLHSHPLEHQTHFLLTAWLNAADKLGDVAMGQEVGTMVTAWLAEYARYPDAGYVTVAWLNAKQDPALVKDAVSHWLVMEKNRVAPEARFVFKAWLDAQQDAGVVQAALIAWLGVAQNRIAPQAQFVFTAWLDAKQDAGVVKDALIDWLVVEQNSIAPEASFVFKAWLDAKQDAGVVKEALIVWLAVEQNRIAPEAQFVFTAWLDTKHAAGVVQEALIVWLTVEQNRIAPEARFVFKAWLGAKQDAGVVKEALIAWLAVVQNRISPAASFVFQAWLDAKQDAGAVKEALIAWLAVEQNRIVPDAQFVFKAWLDAKQDADVVKAALIAWLAVAQNCNAPEAQFVYRAWLDAKQDADVVKAALITWLQVPQNCISQDASFVFKGWLDAKQDTGVVKAALIAWLQVPQNRIAPDASFVFRAWLEAQQDAGVVKEALIAWLAVAQNRIAPDASFVFKGWLDAKQDAGVVKAALIVWLAEPQNHIAPGAHFVFRAWLDAKQDAGVVKEALIAWLAVAQNRIAPAASFVFKGWLDAKQDAGVVKAALIVWLQVPQNRIAQDASFVFRAWLDAKQAPTLIEPHVLTWLAHGNNCTDFGASFIFRAWGNRLKHLEGNAMFQNACRWLQANCHYADAAYCMKYIAGDHRLDQTTANAIITWLTAFPKHEEAPSRLSLLHPSALRHCPSAALTTLYAAVLENYIKPAHRFGEFDMKTTFNLFFNAVRIAKRPTLHPPSRVPLAHLFCQFLRKLSTTQIQHINSIIQHFVGGALPGLIRLGLQNGEPFDPPLINSTHHLTQAYASLGDLGESDAALLRKIAEKQYQH